MVSFIPLNKIADDPLIFLLFPSDTHPTMVVPSENFGGDNFRTVSKLKGSSVVLT